MKSSEILRKAQKRIASGHHDFICLAIGLRGTRQKKLREWIGEMLGESSTLKDWFFNETGICSNREQQRLYRVQWLDQLIAICESEGD